MSITQELEKRLRDKCKQDAERDVHEALKPLKSLLRMDGSGRSRVDHDATVMLSDVRTKLSQHLSYSYFIERKGAAIQAAIESIKGNL